MEKVVIIGSAIEDRRTLSAAIKNVFEIEDYSVYEDAVEKVFELTNPYHLLDTRSPSKSRLKKCAKGLHEFMSEGIVKIDENFYKEKWSCQHCGKNII
jgi:uncharacterized protein with PIN domain